MRIEDVRKVLAIGSGTMGREIGLLCAMHDYQVALYDVSQAVLESALKDINGYLAQLISEKRLTEQEAQAALARITRTTDAVEAARDADLVSESVPEDPRIKRRIFARFNKLCPQRTVFTSNSSYLLPSKLAGATGRPTQFANLHFHHLVWNQNLVDIMPHKGTSAGTVDLLKAFAKRMGLVSVLLRKEHRGYVFNAMYGALNREAIRMAADGVASVEDIDRAIMAVYKAPMGPLGALDHVGLNTVLDITLYSTRWYSFLPRVRRVIKFLRSYVDKGHRGVMDGRGFYTYPNPAHSRPGFLEKGGDPGSANS